MSFSTDWADLLTWTVQFTSPTGTDGYGNRTWSTPVEAQAHVDQATTSQAGPADREARLGDAGQSGVLYVGTEVTPTPGSKVTMPYGSEVEITSVVQQYDDAGEPHHWECNWKAVT